MTPTPTQCHHERDELLRMTERLIREYAGGVAAGTVIRAVSRGYAKARRDPRSRDPSSGDLLVAVEQSARIRLGALSPEPRMSR